MLNTGLIALQSQTIDFPFKESDSILGRHNTTVYIVFAGNDVVSSQKRVNRKEREGERARIPIMTGQCSEENDKSLLTARNQVVKSIRKSTQPCGCTSVISIIQPCLNL